MSDIEQLRLLCKYTRMVSHSRLHPWACSQCSTLGIHPCITGHAHSVLNWVFTSASLGRLTVFCTGYSPLHHWECSQCSTLGIHPCIPGHPHNALNGVFIHASLGRFTVIYTGYSPLHPWARSQCLALGAHTVAQLMVPRSFL